MTMYGYVSGFYKDKIIKDPGFEHRVYCKIEVHNYAT